MRPRLGSPQLALAVAIAAALPAGMAQSQETPATPPGTPYQDRIIATDALQPLPPDPEEALETEGLPRSLRVEALISRSERGDDTFDEQGLSFGGFWETSDWGAFSLDANVFTSDRQRFGALDGDRRNRGVNGTATLWQRNLHLDGGWRVDNGLGVLNTPSLPLQRSQYRFFLPTVPFAGASSQWLNTSRDVQVQAAFGRAGLYNGARVVGFDIADGTVAALGAQWSWSPNWTGAASFLSTNGRIVPDDRGEAVLTSGNTRAVHAATAWQGARDAVQINVLGSNGDQGNAIGAWIDASARRGRYQHNYGAFRLEPGLSWGALPINNDLQGAYYRVAYQYARWSWNAGLDTFNSISGQGFDGSYATGFARYQASSSLGYGGSLGIRSTPDIAYSAQAFADKRTRWGLTRLQLDQARASRNADSWQISVDQAFPLKQGSRLSASAAYGWLGDENNTSTQTTTLALYGGRDLTDTVSIDGNARWRQGQGPGALRGLDLNIGLNWMLSPRWSLAAAFYQNQGSRRSPFILDPLVTSTPFISLPRDRSLYLTLRYNRHAGRPQAVLGGAPGGPVGNIAGSVYLDDNDDGQRAASEQAAPNLTIVLDGRYSVRTDSQGRFMFERVAAGTHTLAVVPDNLPLPWFLPDDGAQRTVQVTVRQDARIDIGAHRRR